jgi:GH25 family lysozyme M1 (1,4-beta-N-acetylmuramidase)
MGTLALAGGALLASPAAASAAASVSTSVTAGVVHTANPHPGWARTAKGTLVRVAPGRDDTPVHPEVLTHPDADHMGSTSAASAPASASGQAVPAATVPQIPGIDVSSHQGNIDWATVAPHINFVYAKATEGTYYTNSYFSNQYTGPYNQGLIRGAYHFAIPDNSGGASQADYFLAHGGGWSSDGKTLPGALDLETNPYGAQCYGLTQGQMDAWIWSFTDEYASRTGVYPVIYSSNSWWTACVGVDPSFADYDPLWIANYTASAGGPRPSGWSFYTFWQYATSGSQPGDQDVFNGALSQLQVLAKNG